MGDSASKRPGDIGPRTRETIREFSDRVWDLAINLVHPAAFYVLFQLLLLDHVGRAPDLARLHALAGPSLLLYGFQFLGAWTVFYTTLLRDMGYRCASGTVLLLAALLGVISQYFLFPDPAALEASVAWSFLGIQMGLAAVSWPLTMRRWWQLKPREPATQKEHT